MIDKLKEWIEESDNIVFFGGAGVSTESGIPDFRSAGGLYAHSPEYMLSRTYFDSNTEEFFDFYRKHMIYTHAKPNTTHRVLADMERRGKVRAVITQNIDGLHQQAGSKNVIELHGGIRDNYCMKCNKHYELEYVIKSIGVPRCKVCGGIVKPNVTLYEEQLNMKEFEKAIEYIKNAEILIVGGTSLVVQPAASLVDYYRGSRMVVINKEEGFCCSRANMTINRGLGEVFSKISEG